MTDRDHVRFDEEGFVDMDAFDAGDPESALDPGAYERLRDALVQAPVPSPSTQRFEQWIQAAVEHQHDALDTASLVPAAAPADEPIDDPAPDSGGDQVSWDELAARPVDDDPDIDAGADESPDGTDQM